MSKFPVNHIRIAAPPDESLPHRLKQTTFALYEPYIQQCLTQWPDPVVINPAPLRATTFAARLRDALIRLRTFETTTTINIESFDSVARDIIVTSSDQSVSIGPRGKRGRGAIGNIQASQSATGIHFNQGRHERTDVIACVQLLSKRLISGPLFITPAIDLELSNLLETNYDVAVQQLENKTVII